MGGLRIRLRNRLADCARNVAARFPHHGFPPGGNLDFGGGLINELCDTSLRDLLDGA